MIAHLCRLAWNRRIAEGDAEGNAEGNAIHAARVRRGPRMDRAGCLAGDDCAELY